MNFSQMMHRLTPETAAYQKKATWVYAIFALLLLMIGGIALMQARWVYAIGSVLGVGGFALLAAEAAGRFKHQAAKVLSIALLLVYVVIRFTS